MGDRKGATHYTHIFQPYIVSIGAEKHDSFADIPKGGKIENCFSGKDLMMGEPDASSFPSGGPVQPVQQEVIPHGM